MNLPLKLKAAAMSAVFIFALCMGHTAVFADTVSATSSNWAGYIAQNGVYTGVSGTWIVPTIAASATLTSNATWVGIGGKTTSDLIQAGVYEIADSDGITYQAWYEMLPGDSTPINLTVSPGDSISVAILETSQNTWNVVITDNTTNQQFEQTVNYQSSLSSAEWIQERPLVNQSMSDLSGFTPVNFTGATAVQNGQRINLAQTDPTMLNLVDAPTNTALAVPSVIGGDDMSFNVARTSAVESPDNALVPSASVPQSVIPIPSSGFHHSGYGVTWVIQFPLRKIE